MLRPTVVVMCMFAVTTMLFTLVHNMEWKSFKHLAFDSGYSHVEVIKSQSDDVRKPEPPCTALMPIFLRGKVRETWFPAFEWEAAKPEPLVKETRRCCAICLGRLAIPSLTISSNSQMDYRFFVLPNGLQVCHHLPETSKHAEPTSSTSHRHTRAWSGIACHIHLGHLKSASDRGL